MYNKLWPTQRSQIYQKVKVQMQMLKQLSLTAKTSPILKLERHQELTILIAINNMKDNPEPSNLELQLLREAEERKEFLKKIGVIVESEKESETKENPIQEKPE